MCLWDPRAAAQSRACLAAVPAGTAAAATTLATLAAAPHLVWVGTPGPCLGTFFFFLFLSFSVSLFLCHFLILGESGEDDNDDKR